jgi:hypothetical protein
MKCSQVAAMHGPSAPVDLSVCLANKYSAARIVAVEMDPNNVEILRENVPGHNVDVVLSAVWSSHSPFPIDPGSSQVVWAVSRILRGEVVVPLPELDA